MAIDENAAFFKLDKPLDQAKPLVFDLALDRPYFSITQSRVQVAQAKVAQQRAAFDQAELNLTYVTITAPADGVIGKVGVNAGQNVSAG